MMDHSTFMPSHEWQDVPPDAVLPEGCQIRLDMSTGNQQARWAPSNGHAEPESELDEAYQQQAACRPDWPQPLDIIGAPELVGWPELTRDCLSPSLHSYVMSEAERLNADPCPIAGHVLAACATSISDAWCVKPKRHDHWTQQARVWSCNVKHVGARGSDVIRAAFWPVRRREAKLRKQFEREMAAWMQRQEERKKNDKNNDPKPVEQRLTTQDATVEAASQILADGGKHAKVTVLCDELVAFLGGFGRYTDKGSAARALWLEGYDGGPQRIDRIIRGNVFVQNWSVIVAGNIQPRRLAGMGKDLIDDGLFQRFMVFHTKPSEIGIADDIPLNTTAGADYRDLHDALAAMSPPTRTEGDPAQCFFDDDARAVRQEFTPLIERLLIDPSLPTVVRETAPKWSGLLARLSLIFHLVDLAGRQIDGEVPTDADLCRVTGSTVTRAATFIRRVVLPNLFRLGFETMPDDGAPAGHARWIAGHVLSHKLDRISARDIGRAYRQLRGKPMEIEQAMAGLCDAGWVAPAEGRYNSLHWRVNPAIHAVFAPAAAAEAARREAVVQAIRRPISDL